MSPPAIDLALFERHESNVRYYSRIFPAVFDRAQGSELFAEDGRRWIDFFSGASALNYGHAPEAVIGAVVDYLRRGGILHALDAATVAKGRFLQALHRYVLEPRGLPYRVQFCGPTGTDAVEAALKLARRITGRTNVVAFSGSYHGKSLGSLAVSGGLSARAAAGMPLAGTTFLPYFDGPDGPFDSVGLLRRMLTDPQGGVELPAAVILEAVQLEGGVYPASVEELRALRALCDAHGMLLIVDEIQSGCGRTGPFFSFERAGIVPDLVTVSKSMGGAGFPIALVLLRQALDQWKPAEHTGTFRGHQLSFVAATAALETFWARGLTEEVEQKGRLVERTLRERLAARTPDVRVRGCGLAWGVDFSSAGGGERVDRILQRAFSQGLVVESCGRRGAVIKLTPPLTISESLLSEGLDVLLSATEAER